MFKQTKDSIYKIFGIVCALFVLAAIVTVHAPVPTAHAAPSTYLNFQGRLLSNTGALVPDGYYNINFKIYNVATDALTPKDSNACTYNTGTADPGCVWTEQYYDANGVTAGLDNRVRVVNGYFSVQLGSQTAFGAINWDQQLWLVMNIGGSTQTATPTYDGEMAPRIQLTAVPLAFIANNVKSGATSTASTNSNAVSIQSGNATGTTSNSGNITIDAGTATGTAGTLLFGTANASALTIGRSGITTTLQGSVSLTGTGTALAVTNNATIGGTLAVTGDVSYGGNLNVIGNTEQQGYISTPYGGLGPYSNLILRSEAFDSATWVKTNITVTADDAGSNPSPYAQNTTADKLVSTAVSATAVQTYTTVNNGNYTFSVYLKTNSGTQPVQLRIDSTSATPTTGTASSFTATTAWQRFSVTQNFTGTPSNIKPTIIIVNNAATVAAWGGQLVAGTSNQVYTNTGANNVVQGGGLISNGGLTIQSLGTSFGTNALTVSNGTILLFNIRDDGNTGIGNLSQAKFDITSTGNAGYFSTSGAGNYALAAYKNSTAVAFLGITNGASQFQNTLDSATGFQVLNQAGNNVLGVNTTAGTIELGKASTLTGGATFFNASGAGSVTLQAANPGASSFTLTLPAETGTVCTTAATGACTATGGFVQLQSATPGTQQTGNLNISGAGIFGGTLAVTGNVSANANLTVGSAAGVGLLTNNGATFNATLVVANDSDGGSLGGTPGSPLTAAASVDIYTSISVNQTTAGQTITLLAPTASTNYGRILYISNVGTTSFTLLGSLVLPGSSAALVWSNTNGGATWQYVGDGGGSGNYIQNQNAADQTANFRIAGTGQISPTANSAVALTVNATTGTAATALAVVQTGNTIAISASGPSAQSSAVGLAVTGITSGTALQANSITTGAVVQATGVTTGSLVSGGGNLTTGAVVNSVWQSTVATTASALRVSGSTSGTLSAYTGSIINVTPTRTHSGATAIDDTGNFLNLQRSNTNSNASGAFTVSGALANLSSNCTVTAGSCTDTSSILSLSQLYANATGTVLNVNSSGSGLLLDLQASSASKFSVSNTGVVTLAGGQTADITSTVTAGAGGALTVKPGTSTGASSNGAATIIKGGDGSGTTTVVGGALTLQAGSATGGSGSRTGGSASLDAGTGTAANGSVLIGNNVSSASILIGSFAGGGTINLGLSSITNIVNIASGNTSNGNTQTVNIGAGTPTGTGLTNINIGNSVNAGSTTLQSATTNINSGTIATTASTLNLFNTNAGTTNVLGASTAITFGATTGTLTVRNANQTFGNAAGSGLLTNNGATVNATLVVADDSDGGALGGTPASPLTAAQSVDVYTSISVNQTTSSQTITLPTPTASTAYGRILYISNVGSVSFSMAGTTVNAGTSVTFIWSNTTGAASWQSAGAGGSGVTTVGSVSGTSTSNGATITGTTLNLAVADATNPGLLSVVAQNIAGAKTFSGAGTFSAAGTALTVTNTTTTGRLGVNTSTFGTVQKFAVNTASTADNAATALIATTAIGDKGLVVQGFTGQTANLFEVQSNAATSLFFVTPGGTAGSNSGFAIATTSTTSGAFTKYTLAGTGGVTANDVVVIANDSGNYRAIRTTTARDTRVYGVAGATAASGASVGIVIGGNLQVTADTGAVAIGDQLVTSTTSGQVMVDNNATTGILGIATTAKAGGSSGLVGVYVHPVGGVVNPNLQAGNLTTTGLITAGTLSVTSTSNFGGLITGSAGATVSGAAISLNDSSNFNTSINGGTSTGGVTIGNTLAGTVSIQSGTNGTGVNIGASTGNIILTGAVVGVSTNLLQFQGSTATKIIRTSGSSSGNSSPISLRTGDSSAASASATGVITIQSGDGTGTDISSGAINIDSGIKTGVGTAGAITLGVTNASAITLGRSGITTTNAGALTVTQAGTFSGNLTVGSAAGVGQLTNNGATVNTTLVVANDSDGGALGGTPGSPLSAAASVDVYTSISVNQTTASQTITLPTPTANTTYGRVIYISNVGSVSFSMSGTTVNPGTSVTFIWSNTTGAASWQSAGAGGSGVTTVGSVSGTSTANGAIITGTTLNLAVADATNPGLLSVVAQNIAGAKTLTGATTLSAAGTALSVTNSATIGGNLTVDSTTLYVDGTSHRVGIGTTNTTNQLLNIYGTAPDIASGTIALINGTLNSTTNNGQTALGILPTISGTTNQNFYGIRVTPQVTGNLTTGGVTGLFDAVTYSGTGTLGSTNGQEVRIDNTSTGTINNATGISINNFINSGGGSLVTGTGLFVYNQTVSTNNSNIVIGTSAPSGNFSIYNASAYDNAFAGNLRVGSTTAPTVALDVTGAAKVSTNLTVGSAAGVGLLTNNGATVNTTLVVANDSDGGSLGGTPGSPLTAAASVDVYTSISVNQTTASQTITLPTPTANTTYGRVIYISNVGSVSFSMSGTTVNPGTSVTFIWSNTTGAASWQSAGAGGSGVTTVGSVSGTSTANGATITGTTLNLAVADATNPGVLSVVAQNIAGAKTFTGATTLSAAGTALTVTNDATIGRLGVNTSTFGTVQKLAVNTASTVDNTATALIASAAAGDKALVVQGFSAQTASIFEVQNNSGTSLFYITAGGTSAALSGFSIATTSTTVGNFSKFATVGTGGISINDVVVIANDSGNYRAIRTTTARDTRVYGVAIGGGSSGATINVGIGGNFQVTADTGAVALGDQLVTSTTSGQVMVDNNATTGILGIATTAKAGGSSGLVGVYIRPVGGVTNPNFGGNVGINTQGTAPTNRLTINTATTADSLAQALISSGVSSNKGLVVQGVASQSANIFEVQQSGGASILTAGVSGSSTVDVAGALRINNGNNNGIPALQVTNSLGSTVAAFIQGAASQTADLLQLRDSTGAYLVRTDATGNTENLGTLNTPFGGFGLYGNFLLYSEQLNNAAWTATNLTVSANAAAAPNGVTSVAEQLTATAANGTLSQSYSTATNGNYNFSIWIKANSGTTPVQLQINSTSATPTSGTATTFTATTTWQRFNVTQNFTGTPSAITPVITVVTNGAVVHAWGAHLSQSAAVPAYQLTTTSIVGAAAGGLSVAGTATFRSSIDGTGTFRVINSGGGTELYVDTTNHYVQVNSVLKTFDSTATSNTLSLKSGDSTTSGNSGGITIQSGNATSGNSGSVTIDAGTATGTKGSISLGTTNAAGVTIGSNAAAGNFLTLEAGNTGTIAIGTGGNAHTINVGTGAAYSGITIGSTFGTSQLNLQAGTGNAGGDINIGDTTVSGKIIDIGSVTNSGTSTIRIGTENGAAQTISLGSINGGSTITLESGNAANAIQIGNSANPHGIQIGNGGTSTQLVSIGSSSSASATTIAAGTGNLLINPGVANNTTYIGTTTAVSGTQVFTLGANTTAGTYISTVTVGSLLNTSSSTIQGGTGATAIALQAGSGGTITVGASAVSQTVSIGNTSGSTGVIIRAGSGNITIGDQGVSNLIQVGSTNAPSTQTITVGYNTDAAAVNTVNLGSSTSTSTTSIRAGTGGLNLGNSGIANTIQIGNTTGAVTQAINIGTNGTASSTSNVTIGSTVAGAITLQSSTTITLNPTGAKVVVGSATSDATQNLLQVDSFSTFADTATCNATTNQGALYYNTNASAPALRTCNNATWQDVITGEQLGIILLGVVDDSGTSPGDLVGVNATDASDGPCKVYQGSIANSVRWTGCTVYSNGRKQVIAAQATDYTTAITTTASAYQNLCIFTAGSGPTFGTANATETSATLPGWSATAPALCLATIKEIAAGSGIGAIYDTRVFASSTKVLTTVATAVSVGFTVKLNGTLGQQTPTGATTDPLSGVIAAYSGTTQTTAINAVVITDGPVYVKATAGTVGQYINPTATTGYVDTSGTVSATAYTNLGIAQSPMNAPGTQCSTTANADTCRGSIFTVINIR